LTGDQALSRGTSRPIARARAAPQAARCPASPGASVAGSVTGLAGDTHGHDAHRFCTAPRRNGAGAVPKRLICARWCAPTPASMRAR